MINFYPVLKDTLYKPIQGRAPDVESGLGVDNGSPANYVALRTPEEVKDDDNIHESKNICRRFLGEYNACSPFAICMVTLGVVVLGGALAFIFLCFIKIYPSA